MAYKLIIREYVTQKLPGDRASNTIDSSHFDVCLGSDRRDRKDELVLNSFNQYDSWDCHVGNREETFNEATRYAHSIALFMKINEPKLVKMVEEKVTETKWVEEKEEFNG